MGRAIRFPDHRRGIGFHPGRHPQGARGLPEARQRDLFHVPRRRRPGHRIGRGIGGGDEKNEDDVLLVGLTPPRRVLFCACKEGNG